jgi:hypothetical protein
MVCAAGLSVGENAGCHWEFDLRVGLRRGPRRCVMSAAQNKRFGTRQTSLELVDVLTAGERLSDAHGKSIIAGHR